MAIEAAPMGWFHQGSARQGDGLPRPWCLSNLGRATHARASTKGDPVVSHAAGVCGNLSTTLWLLVSNG